MTVSIIMPVFNGEKTIARAIESVKSQTYRDWELIVVDDGSTDKSLEIAIKYRLADHRIKTVKLEKNYGQSHARNIGIGTSDGKWITVLDADDIYKNNRLDALISFLEWNHLDMAADNISFYNIGIKKEVAKGIKSNNLNIEWTLKEQLANDLLHKDFKWGLLKPIIKKSFLVESGILYRDQFNMAEDSLLLLELLSFRPKAMICNMPLYVYSTAVGQVSGVASTTSTSRYKSEDHLAVINYFIVEYAAKLSRQENILASKMKKNIYDYNQYVELKSSAKRNELKHALRLIIKNPRIIMFIKKALKKKIKASLTASPI